jgi:hypothetical protein
VHGRADYDRTRASGDPFVSELTQLRADLTIGDAMPTVCRSCRRVSRRPFLPGSIQAITWSIIPRA